MELSKLIFVINNFFNNSKVLNINVLNSGLINNTYLVEHLYDGIKSKFILQRLSNIFESHEILNMNHKLITNHMNKKINSKYFDFAENRWEVPNLIKCNANNLFVFPFESHFWRAMVYVDAAFSTDFLENEVMAYQTGLGLAKFHLFCSDFDSSELGTSVKNFHNTKYYLDQYITTIKNYNFLTLDDKMRIRVQDLIYCLSNHIKYVEYLLLSLKKESIDQCIIHGDPKLSNFLFDIQYKYVVSLIDLDTVSPGFLLSDLADCIRSICNLAGEDPEIKENVHFDINYCKSFIKGYSSINNRYLKCSFNLLPQFIYLIIFELTIRFFTDFLQSNKYFKIKYVNHNLFKAEVQYRLLSSFLTQILDFSNEINKIGISSSSTFVSDVQKFV